MEINKETIETLIYKTTSKGKDAISSSFGLKSIICLKDISLYNIE